MEYKIADLNLKNVNLISGDNDKQDGYFAKNKYIKYMSQIPQRN
jgi:hypothetical protein